PPSCSSSSSSSSFYSVFPSLVLPSPPSCSPPPVQDDSWMEDLFELLSDSERSRVRREDSVRGRYGVFQRLWSAKEAVTKAIGRGLDFSIERIEVALDGEVQSAWPSWAQRGACRSGDRVAARSALGPRCTQDFGGAPHGPEGTPREA
ncbi:unnamed protein product, partial [Prorocentrum cordatum]